MMFVGLSVTYTTVMRFATRKNLFEMFVIRTWPSLFRNTSDTPLATCKNLQFALLSMNSTTSVHEPVLFTNTCLWACGAIVAAFAAFAWRYVPMSIVVVDSFLSVWSSTALSFAVFAVESTTTPGWKYHEACLRLARKHPRMFNLWTKFLATTLHLGCRQLQTTLVCVDRLLAGIEI